MSGECGQGALQTRGTCWFYSIINGFMLSEDGQKILYAQMQIFYATLSPNERKFFDDPGNSPCPVGTNAAKFNVLYFYKFLDQYTCFIRGRRNISLKAGKSAELLRNASLIGNIARKNKGAMGAFPHQELPVILKKLGFEHKYKTFELGETIKGTASSQFIVVNMNNKKTMTVKPPKAGYKIMCASLIIENTEVGPATQHAAHAITPFVCNDKGYLFDSNRRVPFPCTWWDPEKLMRVINTHIAPHYVHFKNGKITRVYFSYVAYSKQEFVSKISPSCMLKRKDKGPIITYKILKGVLNNSNSREKFNRALSNLENAGYILSSENRRKLMANANLVFRAAAPIFENTKSRLLAAPTKAARIKIYSGVWKRLSMEQRKILIAIRDAKTKTPPVNRTTKLVSNFKQYWGALTSANRAILRTHLKSPSPVRNFRTNVNALKTAVARKKYLKEHPGKNVAAYIKAADEANRQRRAIKKGKAKA